MGAEAERGQGMTSVCARACVCACAKKRIANDEEEIRSLSWNSEVCKSEIRKTKL